MLPLKKQELAPAPRVFEVLIGLALGLFALVLSTAAIYMSFRIVSGDKTSSELVVFVVVTLLLGMFCATAAFRLTSGKGRKSDGGLFPPWLLRFLSLFFFAASCLLAYHAFEDREFGLLGHASGMIGLGLGCFYLAYRQQHKSDDSSGQ